MAYYYNHSDADSTYPDTGQVDLNPSSTGLAYPDSYYTEYPGYVARGSYVGQADAFIGDWPMPESYSWGSEDNLVTNPQIYGTPGLALTTPIINAGVDANNVENFELNGWQAAFAPIQTKNFGPVGFGDFAGVLGASVIALDYEYPLPADSYRSLVLGV